MKMKQEVGLAGDENLITDSFYGAFMCMNQFLITAYKFLQELILIKCICYTINVKFRIMSSELTCYEIFCVESYNDINL